MASRATARSGKGRNHAARSARVTPMRIFDAKRYGGQWVATRHGEVVASGDSFAEVDVAVRKMGLQDEVILTRVPEKGELAR